jgi:hypothetical protein
VSLGKGEHTIHKKWRENQTNEVYMQLNARNKRRRKHFATKVFYTHILHQMKLHAVAGEKRKISPRGTEGKRYRLLLPQPGHRGIQYLNLIYNNHTSTKYQIPLGTPSNLPQLHCFSSSPSISGPPQSAFLSRFLFFNIGFIFQYF